MKDTGKRIRNERNRGLLKSIRKKAGSRKGETLIESLCSILIIALISGFFLSMAGAAVNINKKAAALEEKYRIAYNDAAAGDHNVNGTVTINGTDVNVLFNESEDIRSYELRP